MDQNKLLPLKALWIECRLDHTISLEIVTRLARLIRLAGLARPTSPTRLRKHFLKAQIGLYCGAK